jgi:hypothetical protein
MDAYDGCELDSDVLRPEIAEMSVLIEQTYRRLEIDQDLGLGMMLWLAHFFPEESWATTQAQRALPPPGLFQSGTAAARHKVRIHQFWRFLGSASDAGLARTRRAPKHIL